MQKIINIITLGCAKNTVDSEKFAYIAENHGFKVYHNSETNDFNIAIVNTCGFINDAKVQSIDTILDLVALKKNKNLEKIIVFGCLSERYMNDLKQEIPEVDVFLGNYNPNDLMSALNVQNRKTYNIYGRIFESANHYSYLKIAEGCNRNCSFCAIPLFKGKYVSRETDEILQEAKVLSDNGVKELLLIAQDLSFYGYDLKKKFLLSELIEKLSVIDGIEWIRMHYLYPFLFPEMVIDIAAENPKICKYFDIPVQHISDKILQMMNRGGTKAETYKLIEKIRKKIPDAAIRTSLLVGHPGEGKREFEELLEFVKIIKFDRLGVFEYSEEEGTKSAKNYKDTIKTSVKKQRSKMIMDIQAEISLELNLKKVGRSFKTIVDEFDGKFYYGRTEFDSPEVDNEVIFTSLEKIETGQFVQVNIESADEYSLRGKKI